MKYLLISLSILLSSPLLAGSSNSQTSTPVHEVMHKDKKNKKTTKCQAHKNQSKRNILKKKRKSQCKAKCTKATSEIQAKKHRAHTKRPDLVKSKV